MKKTVRIMLAATLLALAGCWAYVGVTRLTQEAYPPTAACEVFAAGAPQRPYTEIAMIRVDQGNIETARKKAMELGADAIVMRGDEVSGSMALGNGLIGTASKSVFVAVKWKD